MSITINWTDDAPENFRASMERFAQLLHDEQRAVFVSRYPDLAPDRDTAVKVHFGKKYARFDVGSSGKYMVDMATGEIFGIKGYGVPHKGHRYGTLETVASWHWGEYHAGKKAPAPQEGAGA